MQQQQPQVNSHLRSLGKSPINCALKDAHACCADRSPSQEYAASAVTRSLSTLHRVTVACSSPVFLRGAIPMKRGTPQLAHTSGDTQREGDMHSGACWLKTHTEAQGQLRPVCPAPNPGALGPCNTITGPVRTALQTPNTQQQTLCLWASSPPMQRTGLH